jgi:hypothetical protein
MIYLQLADLGSFSLRYKSSNSKAKKKQSEINGYKPHNDFQSDVVERGSRSCKSLPFKINKTFEDMI